MTKSVLVLAAVLGLAACSGRAVPATGRATGPTTGLPSGLPVGQLTISRAQTGAQTGRALHLQVQIAETTEARTNGLMGVSNLSDAGGMAFLFDSPVTDPFWMKNTLIPLDIAFWDQQGHIVTMLTMEPCKADPCRYYNPTARYVGAVEMNKGLLAKDGVTAGDTVRLTR